MVGCFTPRKRRRRKYEEFAKGDTVVCVTKPNYGAEARQDPKVGEQCKVIALHPDHKYDNPLVQRVYGGKPSIAIERQGYSYIAPAELFQRLHV